MKVKFSAMLLAGAMSFLALGATQASATTFVDIVQPGIYEVYDPASSGLPGVSVSGTGGTLIQSWFVPDSKYKPAPPESNSAYPANQSAATIETWAEQSDAHGNFIGHNIDYVGQVDSCAGGNPNFDCSEHSATSNFLANIFAIHIGGAELLFVFDALISDFHITLPDTSTGLSNIRAYKDITSTIPLPGALPLLVTGLAGLGFLARRRSKKA